MRQPDRENNPCPKCNGLGWRNYGNTSKWIGGIGGQAITGGLCDECWGSGDADVPTPDFWAHRAYDAIQDAISEFLPEENADG